MCKQVMANLNLSDLVGQPYGTNRHYSVRSLYSFEQVVNFGLSWTILHF